MLDAQAIALYGVNAGCPDVSSSVRGRSVAVFLVARSQKGAGDSSAGLLAGPFDDVAWS
jgi:hypothetical protein